MAVSATVRCRPSVSGCTMESGDPVDQQEVAATLLAIEPSGRFIEPVSLEVHTATRG